MDTAADKQKRGGRPVKDYKKENRVGIRFTKGDYFIITEKAGQAGLTLSAYIREIAIKGMVVARLTLDQWKAVKELAGMSNNLNQVAKALHKEGALIGMRYFENYREQLDVILKKIRGDQ